MSTAQHVAGDETKVTVSVAVSPEKAFAVFTEEIELWWRRGPRFRNAPGESGLIAIEPRLGGRVFESFGSGGQPSVVEIGRITAWDPPRRLLFDWRKSNFAANEKTEVEVLFEPRPSGTRVTVIHRGLSALRPDHPARHGLAHAAFARMIGLWWGDLMTSLRLRCGDAYQ